MPPKSVLITGCGPGGIGSALARTLHIRGHRVFATGRTTAEIDSELSTMGIETFTLDVTCEDSIKSAVAKVKELTDGRLDVLVNNAGVLQIKPFADTSPSEAKRVYEVNVFGVWAVTHAFLPLLLEAQGLVVAVSSISSVFCPPFIASYASSKAAVEAMMRTMRRELAPLGVRTMVVKTGVVTTDMTSNSKAALPSDSLYGSLRSMIESKTPFAGKNPQNREEYADAVVDEVLREKTKAVVWQGGMVWVAWFLSWLGWETMLVGHSTSLATCLYSPSSG